MESGLITVLIQISVNLLNLHRQTLVETFRYPSMFFVIKVQCLTNKETNEQMHGTNVSYERDSNLETNTIATELMRILVKEFQFEFCAYFRRHRLPVWATPPEGCYFMLMGIVQCAGRSYA